MATDTRISVGQYLSMIESGAFPDEAHLELLGGRLVEQMTKFAPHNYTSRQLGILLKGLIPEGWLISEEKSVMLGRLWRPEPDLAVLRGPNRRYRQSDPVASDIGLLIEVSESSYATDRGEKWRAYAARIPIYWIVNLNQSQVEVYADPAGRGKQASYRDAATFGSEAEVPVVIDGRDLGRVSVKDVLP